MTEPPGEWRALTGAGGSELRALTGARGIAAWLVVGYHLRGAMTGLPDWVNAALAKGYLAVDFFFLLSGFVIWLAWSTRLRDAGLAGAAGFWWKRLARIAPLHLVTMAGAMAMAGVLAVAGHADRSAFPWATLPANLLLVQEWGTTDRLSWNDPAWSISAEVLAYLAFPLLIAGVDWRRVPTAGLIATMSFAFGALALMMHGAASLGDAIPAFGALRCMAEFISGTVVCALWMRWQAWRLAPAATLAVAAAAALAWHSGASEIATAPTILAATLLFLALTAGRRGNPLESRAVHQLGIISYATYLAHFLLWKAVKLAFVASGQPAGTLIILAYSATLLLGSMLLYRTVERPALRWLTKLRVRRSIHAIPAEVQTPHQCDLAARELVQSGHRAKDERVGTSAPS